MSISRTLALAVAVLLLAKTAVAQTGSDALPSDPSQWINSAPITAEALKGKAAVLWYFEEDCPRCRAKWPELVNMAKSFEGKPIVFIAVNSGNARPSVEQYVRGVRLPWPVIVDPLREFEKSSNVGEISLQNIYQMKLIMPDGSMRSGNFGDVKASAEAALAGAKWNVDPSEITETLLPAWQAIELGNFSAGAVAVKRALRSSNDETKESATKLNDYVNAEMQKMLEQAKSASGANAVWEKYKIYLQISERFNGFDLPDELSDMKQMASDPAVKDQLTAFRQLELVKKSLQSSSRAAQAGAVRRLKQLIETSPDTDAAKEAEGILKQLGV